MSRKAPMLTPEFNGILEVNGSWDVRSPVPLPIAVWYWSSFDAVNQGLVTTRSILVAQAHPLQGYRGGLLASRHDEQHWKPAHLGPCGHDDG